MKQKLLLTFALLLTAVLSAWADFVPKSGDVWDNDTKTLTVNSNPGIAAYMRETEIQHLVIAVGVTTIGNSAFWGCTSLTSVTIPASVTSIDNGAFYGCTGLSVTLYAPSCTLGSDVFGNCDNLNNIYVLSDFVDDYKAAPSWSKYVSKITGLTGGNCGATGHESDVIWAYNETTHTLTITITKVGETGAMADYANNSDVPWYSNREAITSVVIESGVTSIGNKAFDGCKELPSITIPASVTSIGDRAFESCTNLDDVTLYSNPYIGESAFNNIKGYATVTMKLTGNEGESGEYWMTFYNKNCNFSVPSTTKIFKASLSGSTLTLTELTTDMRVNQDNAVILKSTSANITLVYQTIGGSNDFTGNQLQGVSNPEGLVSDGTTYVLNKTAAKGVGFYKLQAGSKLGVGKAYLTYSGGGSSNFFDLDDDGTTSIDVRSKMSEVRGDVFFDLNGRRVMNPTKGIYIHNGSKVIIK